MTQTASLGGGIFSNKDSSPEVWLSAIYSNVDQDGSAGNVDFDTDAYELSAGVSDIGTGPLSFGFAAGYAQFETNAEPGGAIVGEADEVETNLFRLGAHARLDINEQAGGIQAHFDVAGTWADGSHDVVQNIGAGAIDVTNRQTGETDLTHLGGTLRLTLDGSGGQEWAIKPYVSGSVDNYDQDAFILGSGATQIAVGEIDNTRYSVGYGADLKRDITDNAYLRLGASGTHHFNDTEANFLSSFSSSTGDGFATVGSDVENQYFFDGSLGTELANGLKFEGSVFGQLGDLDAWGGGVKIAKKF